MLVREIGSSTEDLKSSGYFRKQQVQSKKERQSTMGTQGGVGCLSVYTGLGKLPLPSHVDSELPKKKRDRPGKKPEGTAPTEEMVNARLLYCDASHSGERRGIQSKQ